MAKVIQIHIWLKDKKERWREPEVVNPRSNKPMKGKRIVLEPESDSLTGMKIQVAREIQKWYRTGELLSYYVVVVVRREDGEIAYRTIVRTTVMK
jgi:ribosomal protein S5